MNEPASRAVMLAVLRAVRLRLNLIDNEHCMECCAGEHAEAAARMIDREVLSKETVPATAPAP